MSALRPYIVYFKFQNPGEKKPGPMRQYRLYAKDPIEARRLTEQYAKYPNLEIIKIREHT